MDLNNQNNGTKIHQQTSSNIVKMNIKGTSALSKFL